MTSKENLEKGLLEEIIYWLLVHEAGYYSDSEGMHADCLLRKNVHCGNCPVAIPKASQHSIPCPKEIRDYIGDPTAARHTKVIEKLIKAYDEITS